MMALQRDFHSASGPTSGKAKGAKRAPPRHKITRDCPRVTVRLSPEDHEKLKDLADGMALSTYLRLRALGDDLPRRRRSGVAVENREVLAQILGLLGQSRIANNLNQLAYHANVGSLEMDDVTQAQIAETYDHVIHLRETLIKALGFSG